MKKIIKYTVFVLILVLVLPLVGGGLFWFSLSPYSTLNQLSNAPADKGGAVKSLTRDWLIFSSRSRSTNKIIFTYTVGEKGLRRGGRPEGFSGTYFTYGTKNLYSIFIKCSFGFFL